MPLKKKPVKKHSVAEKLALKRHKQRHGGAAQRRRARRLAKFGAPTHTQTKCDGNHPIPPCRDPECWHTDNFDAEKFERERNAV